MIRLNQNPQSVRYAYKPIRSVTSLFLAGRDVQGVVQALTRAGFRDDQIDLFSGEIGADQLDTEGQLHGFWDMFADEAQLFHRADQTMRSGGSVVVVFTAGKAEERRRASDILMSHGGIDTVYWGRLVTEHM